MSSPVATPDAALASVQSTAANALATALGSDSSDSPPASSPTPDPASAPPAQAAPSTEAPPPAAPSQAPPATAPAAPTTIDTSGLSPEAQRFLQMQGGDINQALAKALEYNNRLAAVARGEAPAPGTPPAAPATPPAAGTTPAPAPTAAAPQVPPAAAPVDPKAIQAEVDRFLGADQEAVRLATEFAADVQRVQEIDAQVPNLDGEIQYLTRRLQDEDVKGDEVAEGNIREKVRDLKELRAERRDVVRHAQDLDGKYNGRAAQYEQRINGRYEAERAKADSDAKVNSHAEALSVAWQPAVQRAITTNKIPASLAPKFEVLARRAALANLELGFAVEEVDSFLDKEAKDFLEVGDAYHREKAAELGDKTRDRAMQPGPPAAETVATAQVPKSDNLDEVYKNAHLRLTGRL